MKTIFGAAIPFANYCGIVPIEGSAERARLSVTLADEHKNHLGVAHGGFIATLLDVALGTVARIATGHMVATINLQTSFIAPGRGELIGEGRVVRQGRSIVFCEGDVRDAEGTLVATASGVFKILRDASPEPNSVPA